MAAIIAHCDITFVKYRNICQNGYNFTKLCIGVCFDGFVQDVFFAILCVMDDG
jgi:hypothetical protein